MNNKSSSSKQPSFIRDPELENKLFQMGLTEDRIKRSRLTDLQKIEQDMLQTENTQSPRTAVGKVTTTPINNHAVNPNTPPSQDKNKPSTPPSQYKNKPNNMQTIANRKNALEAELKNLNREEKELQNENKKHEDRYDLEASLSIIRGFNFEQTCKVKDAPVDIYSYFRQLCNAFTILKTGLANKEKLFQDVRNGFDEEEISFIQKSTVKALENQRFIVQQLGQLYDNLTDLISKKTNMMDCLQTNNFCDANDPMMVSMNSKICKLKTLLLVIKEKNAEII